MLHVLGYTLPTTRVIDELHAASAIEAHFQQCGSEKMAWGSVIKRMQGAYSMGKAGTYTVLASSRFTNKDLDMIDILGTDELIYSHW